MNMTIHIQIVHNNMFKFSCKLPQVADYFWTVNNYKRSMNAAAIIHYQNKLSFEMDPSDLFEALNAGEPIVVIDARKPFAYEYEHIPGAVNLPHRQMNAATTSHLKKDQLYVVYCDGIGCNASTRGALNLAKLGFDVRELMGGIVWWKFDGYETAGTQAQTGLKVSCSC